MSAKNTVEQYHTNKGFDDNERKLVIQDGKENPRRGMKTLLEISFEFKNVESYEEEKDTNISILSGENDLERDVTNVSKTNDGLDISENDRVETGKEVGGQEASREHDAPELVIANTDVDKTEKHRTTEASESVVVVQPTNDIDNNNTKDYLKIDLKQRQFPSSDYSEKEDTITDDQNNKKYGTTNSNEFEEIVLEDVETKAKEVTTKKSDDDRCCCFVKYKNGLFCCKR